MTAPYESAGTAVLDAAAALAFRFRRHPLATPHRCDACKRTVASVPMSAPISPDMPCRRLTWALNRCNGRLRRAGAPT